MTSNLQRYQRIAALYDLLDLPFEHGRYRKIRPLLFEGLSGRILDAGIGTGRNIPFYPPGAAVIGVDFSPAMLTRAERRAKSLGAAVKLRRMDVTQLAFPDNHFDAAVASFLFCVLPNEQQVSGLKELRRVVKPGGLVRLLEYTRPKGRVRRFLTHLWRPWIKWAYGADFDRRTEKHIPEAGLKLLKSEFVIDDLYTPLSRPATGRTGSMWKPPAGQ